MLRMPAAYVLSGGRSSRMGQPKSGLAWRGTTLLQFVAGQLAETTGGPCTVVGGLPIPELRFIPDPREGFGPVSGIATALRDAAPGSWALVAACDMPTVAAGFLRTLLAAARENPVADAVIPVTGDGRIHPLCALWRRDAALPAFEKALAEEVHRVRDVVAELAGCVFLASGDHTEALRNVNTPEEWAALLQSGVPERQTQEA